MAQAAKIIEDEEEFLDDVTAFHAERGYIALLYSICQKAVLTMRQDNLRSRGQIVGAANVLA